MHMNNVALPLSASCLILAHNGHFAAALPLTRAAAVKILRQQSSIDGTLMTQARCTASQSCPRRKTTSLRSTGLFAQVPKIWQSRLFRQTMLISGLHLQAEDFATLDSQPCREGFRAQRGAGHQAKIVPNLRKMRSKAQYVCIPLQFFSFRAAAK